GPGADSEQRGGEDGEHADRAAADALTRRAGQRRPGGAVELRDVGRGDATDLGEEAARDQVAVADAQRIDVRGRVGGAGQCRPRRAVPPGQVAGREAAHRGEASGGDQRVVVHDQVTDLVVELTAQWCPGGAVERVDLGYRDTDLIVETVLGDEL